MDPIRQRAKGSTCSQASKPDISLLLAVLLIMGRFILADVIL